MDSIRPFLTTPTHSSLVDDLLALPTPEDRLAWLMERQPIHVPLVPAERTDTCKVSGCVSGLWLAHERRGSLLFFSAYGESSIVHGVASFICDLYSERTTEEITRIKSQLALALKIDGLLSITRKRALAGTLEYIHAIALGNQDLQTAA